MFELDALAKAKRRPKRRPPRMSGIVAIEGFSVLQTIAIHQKMRCAICGEPLTLKVNGPDGLTFDHVFPWSLKKKDAGNLLAAHRSCNRRKADRLPTACELIMLAAVNLRLGLG